MCKDIESDRIVYKVVVKTGLRKGFISKNINDEYGYLENIEDFIDMVKNINSKYIALIPDIIYPEISSTIDELVDKLENEHADIAIVKARPRGVFDKVALFLGKIITLSRLSKITGYPNGLLVIMKQSLLSKDLGSSNIKEIIMNAKRIVEVYYEVPISIYVLLLYSGLPKPLLVFLGEPTRVLRFAIVGALGAIVNIVVVTVAAMYLGVSRGNPLSLVLPVVLGFESSVVFNFILHELWTFRDIVVKKNIVARFIRLIKYHMASITSFFVQLTTVTLLYTLLGLWLPLSTAIGIILGFIVNYLLGRLYTWHDVGSSST